MKEVSLTHEKKQQLEQVPDRSVGLPQRSLCNARMLAALDARRKQQDIQPASPASQELKVCLVRDRFGP